VSDKKEESSGFREALEKKVQSAEEPKKKPGPAPSGGGNGEPKPPTPLAAILAEPIALFGPKLQDVAIFCRQLATLLDVGIPLVRSLRILSERSQHPKLKRVAGQVAQDVEEGHRLSDALAKHRNVFSALLINVTRVGEAGGILEGSLNRLADTMEQKVEIRKKSVSACMYPAVALLVAAVVLIIILVKAIPVFASVYEDLPNAGLPKITQRVIDASNFAKGYWMAAIPVFIVVLAGLWVWGKTTVGRAVYDWLWLNVPIVGGINTKINVARSTRTLGNLLDAGIPLLEGLAIVSKTSENVHIGKALAKARDNVERGGKMDEPLRRAHVFPPMVVDMMTIGDEAGALDTMLLKIADIYDMDVDSSLRGLTSLIEPLLIVLLGGIVLIIALAVFMPYFGLARSVGVE
jgi:type IV pilus assembly protein PilC